VCGIFGWNNIDKKTKEEIIEANKRRGNYSFGFLINKKNFRVLKGPIEEFTYDVINYDFVLGQFRSPTIKLKEFVYDENYPLKINENFYLFGNGVINASFFKELREKFNCKIENDLFCLGKGIEKEGIEFLEKVDGVFALSLVFVENKVVKKVLLVRNTFPLFFSENFYSSVKIKNSKELKNGFIYDWLNGEIVERLNFEEQPFLL